jgi:hypothetical protein
MIGALIAILAVSTASAALTPERVNLAKFAFDDFITTHSVVYQSVEVGSLFFLKWTLANHERGETLTAILYMHYNLYFILLCVSPLSLMSLM